MSNCKNTRHISVSSPGKLILFGEHAVVYHKKAIATSLDDLRTFIDLRWNQCDNHGDNHGENDDASTSSPYLSFDSAQIGVSSFRIPLHKFKQQHLSPKSFLSSSSDDNDVNVTVVDKYSFTPRVNPDIVRELTRVIREEQELSDNSDDRSIVSLIGTIYLFLYLSALSSLSSSVNNSSGDEWLSKMSIELKATTTLPIGAGLGSSASFSVCLSAAMLCAFNWIQHHNNDSNDSNNDNDNDDTLVEREQEQRESKLNLINKWAYFIEELIHGTPSGIDNTVATFGGVVSFIKGQAPVKLNTIPGHLKLLIVDTTVPKDTKALVAGVRQRYESDESTYAEYMQQIESCSNQCLSLFEQMKTGSIGRSSYVSQLGAIIDQNQVLLETIGVGHAALSKVVAMAKRHGLHAKLTGAGGGGCSYVLLDCDEHTTKDFIDELSNEGFKCYMSNVGHEGVIIHDTTATTTTTTTHGPDD